MGIIKDEILLRIDADIKGLVSKISAGREEMEKFKTRSNEIKEQMKLLAKQGESSGVIYKDLAKELVLVDAEFTRSSKSVRSYQSALERTLTGQKANEGSLESLRAQLSAATNAFDKLDQSTREYSEEGKALKAGIQELNAELLKQETQTGRNQRNVGNYKSALDGVREKLLELASLKTPINPQGFDQATGDISTFTSSIGYLGTTTSTEFKAVEKDLIDTGKTAIDTAASIKELTQIMKAFGDASLIASAESRDAFVKLASEAKDKIGDLKQEITKLASDTSAFDAIGQGVNVVVSGFGAIQGAASIFGKENENVQAALNKTANALLVVNSVTSITNALQKESSLIIKGTAAATAIWNFSLAASDKVLKALRISTLLSAGGLNAFKVALASTGIGAIIVGIGLLIANFDKVGTVISDVNQKIDKMGKWFYILSLAVAPFLISFKLIYEGLNLLGKAIGVLDSEQAERIKSNLKLREDEMLKIGERYDFEIRLAKAAGNSTKKIEQEKLQAQNESIKEQIKNLVSLQVENGKLTDEQLSKLSELKTAWKKNFQDIIISQTEFNAEQKNLSNQANIALLNAELKKQSLLGQDTTAKQLQIARQEYDIAIENARRKGEDTTAIESNYEQKKFEIQFEASQKRKDLEIKIREIQISLIGDTYEREIETEKLALEKRLSEISGFGEKENQLRVLIKEQSKQKLDQLAKQQAQEELNAIIENEQRKFELSSNAINAKDQLELSSARTRAERFAAELQIENDKSTEALNQKQLNFQKDFQLQEQKTQEELERVKATKEFINSTEQEQQEITESIIQKGIDAKRTLVETSNAELFAITEENVQAIAELTRQYQLDELNSQAEFNQLQQDAELVDFQTQLDQKTQQLNIQEQIELNSKNRTEQEKSLIHKKYETLRTQITRENLNAQLDAITNILSQSGQLFKKNTIAYKTIAIAQASINTYKAANEALASAPPPYGAILAGITIALGLVNVAKIASVNTDAGFKEGGFPFSTEGGFTGEGNPNNVSKNVGVKPYTYHYKEYIIPDPVMKDPVVSSFVHNVAEPLRKQKLRGSISSNSFASGGFPNTNAPVQNVIVQQMNPDQLQSAIETAFEKMPPVYTVLEDVNTGLKRVTTIQDRANH